CSSSARRSVTRASPRRRSPCGPTTPITSCTGSPGTNGGGSRWRTTRGGRRSTPPLASVCRRRRRYAAPATTWHSAFRRSRTLRWSRRACASTRTRRTSTSSSIATRPRRTPGWWAEARGTASSTGRRWASWWHDSYSPTQVRTRSSACPASGSRVHAQLEQDFERFKRGLPRDFAAHVRAAYRIDLSGRYAGEPLPHPIGKGSGQLSLNAGQLEEDAAAGLAFVVLKTVIAEDDAGVRAMAAWAIHETRMRVERRAAADGRPGWTVTWKGRGWDRTLDEYVALVRAGRDLTRAGGPLVVPSVKYHLPRLDEPFRDAEYRHTTARVAQAWGTPPLIVEKDFSPTLAGDTLADDPRTHPGTHRHWEYRVRSHDPRLRPPRLRERAVAHLLPAPPVRVRRDSRLPCPKSAARARVSPHGRSDRGDARARSARRDRA